MFLDEIGEVDATIQVKLLRVLHSRMFQRLGETEPRRFEGKIIAATNRDLAAEMQVGRFREDFYYRICADMIATPTLKEQLAGSAENLRDLALFIARRDGSSPREFVAPTTCPIFRPPPARKTLIARGQWSRPGRRLGSW